MVWFGFKSRVWKWVWLLFKRLELLLIAVCLFLTVGIVIDGQRKNSIAATAEFERVSDSALTALQSRMNLYLQSLNGAAGMMQTSENTEYDDFEVYVQSLSIETYLPGINGIGFIAPVAADRLDEVIAKMRADGVADFQVHPVTDNDVKYIIKYILAVTPPLSGNGFRKRGFYRVGVRPVRRA